MDALSDIYKSLEVTPDGGLTRTRDGRDYFDVRPSRPRGDENQYNKWITRFDLSRAKKTSDLDGFDVTAKDNMCVRGVEMTLRFARVRGVRPWRPRRGGPPVA